MTGKTIGSQRWLVSLTIAAAALAIGAVLGNAASGSAAAQAPPKNTAAPTISGLPRQAATLAASQGTWTGNPTSFSYAWSRCDRLGDKCTAVAGATATSYAVQAVDVGGTLRVTVTAKNAAGSTSATSTPTAVIAGAGGCPAGTGTIQVADLAPPARLSIDQPSMTPAVATPATTTIQLRFQITACNGRPVQGASLYATPSPYNQFTVGQGTSAADGFVTTTMTQMSGFPADRRQQLLTVFARANKPGEPVLGGVSTRRLFTFPVQLH